MSLDISTTKEIYTRIIADIESALAQNTPDLAKAFNKVLSIVESGEFTSLYRFFLDQKKQGFPQNSVDPILKLWEALANEFPEPATPAQLTVSGTGTNGTIIGIGSLGPVWIANNGVTYTNTVEATIASGVVSLTIQARQTGEVGNLSIGETLSLTSAVTGLNDQVEVTAIATTGEEAQSVESRQIEVVQKFQSPPQGGAPADFFQWATDVQNIVDAYPYAGNVPGRILLYIKAGDQTDGIPTSTQITQVTNYIEDPTRLPLFAEDLLPSSQKRFEVLASTVNDFIVTITGLDPDVQSLKDAIDLQIENYYESRRPYVSGLHANNEGDIRLSKLVAIIEEQLEINNGTNFADVEFALASDPLTLFDIYTLPQGLRAKAGTINYV